MNPLLNIYENEDITEENIGQVVEYLNEKKRRNAILKEHQCRHKITEEKSGCFSTYVSDKSKPKGIRQIRKKTRQELEDAIIQFYEKDDVQANQKEGAKQPFSEVVKQAILSKKNNLPATKNRKMGDYATYIKYSELGQCPVGEITIDDIVDFMLDTIEVGGKYDVSRKKVQARNGDIRLQEQAAKNIRTIIVQGMKYASRRDWTTINPEKLLERLADEMDCDIYYVPQETDLDYVLTENQLRAVIKLIDEMDYNDQRKNRSKDSAVVDQGIKLTIFCGCRVGELSSLKWSDIKDNVMSLQRRESRGRVFDENGNPVQYVFDVLPGLKKRKAS